MKIHLEYLIRRLTVFIKIFKKLNSNYIWNLMLNLSEILIQIFQHSSSILDIKIDLPAFLAQSSHRRKALHKYRHSQYGFEVAGWNTVWAQLTLTLLTSLLNYFPETVHQAFNCKEISEVSSNSLSKSYQHANYLFGFMNNLIENFTKIKQIISMLIWFA